MDGSPGLVPTRLHIYLNLQVAEIRATVVPNSAAKIGGASKAAKSAAEETSQNPLDDLIASLDKKENVEITNDSRYLLFTNLYLLIIIRKILIYCVYVLIQQNEQQETRHHFAELRKHRVVRFGTVISQSPGLLGVATLPWRQPHRES